MVGNGDREQSEDEKQINNIVILQALEVLLISP